MPYVIESHDSRKFSTGPGGKVLNLKYTVAGVPSEDDVSDLLRAECPVVLSGLVRGEIDADPLGGGVWKVTVPYSSKLNESQAAGETPVAPEAPGPSTPLNSSEAGGFNAATLSFDTTGGQIHITQSVATRSSTGRGANTPADHKGAIGVSKDGVAGCDIFAPKLEITIGVERANVTLDYVYGLRALTGKTNNAPWWNFATDECLYLGASGQGTSNGKWTVSHKLAVGENQVDVAICAGLTVPAIKAWDYLWVAYEPDEDASRLIQVPHSAYVEQVYRQGNFAIMGIGA